MPPSQLSSCSLFLKSRPRDTLLPRCCAESPSNPPRRCAPMNAAKTLATGPTSVWLTLIMRADRCFSTSRPRLARQSEEKVRGGRCLYQHARFRSRSLARPASCLRGAPPRKDYEQRLPLGDVAFVPVAISGTSGATRMLSQTAVSPGERLEPRDAPITKGHILMALRPSIWSFEEVGGFFWASFSTF